MKLRVNVILSSLAVLTGVGGINAQVNWFPSSAPSPRCCMGMASAATGESSPVDMEWKNQNLDAALPGHQPLGSPRHDCL